MFRYELGGCRANSLLANAFLFTLDAIPISRGSLKRRRVRTRRCACKRIGFPRPGLAILLSSLWWQWSVTVGGREKEEARGESCAVGGLELIARHVTALRTLPNQHLQVPSGARARYPDITRMPSAGEFVFFDDV